MSAKYGLCTSGNFMNNLTYSSINIKNNSNNKQLTNVKDTFKYIQNLFKQIPVSFQVLARLLVEPQNPNANSCCPRAPTHIGS